MKLTITTEYIIETYDTSVEARRRYLELSRQQKYPSRKTVGKKVKEYQVMYRARIPEPTCNVKDDIVRNFRPVGIRDTLDKHLSNKERN